MNPKEEWETKDFSEVSINIINTIPDLWSNDKTIIELGYNYHTKPKTIDRGEISRPSEELSKFDHTLRN